MTNIRLNNITKSYATGESAVRAVDDITLGINWGEFVGVSGESGSGKSTLLSIMGAMIHPDSGLYSVDDIDIYSLGTEKRADFRREYLGFVFQSFHLMPYLSAEENVMLPLVITKRSSGEKLYMAREAMDRVGLTGKYRRLPDELSGGERERVAVARAIVNRPPVLLADEPTGNLDSKTSGGVMDLFRELNSAGMTIIMVSHSAECISNTSRVIKLSDGRIVSG